MRIVHKPVYYCDHCNKRYLSKASINKHEPACTANPARRCGSCGNAEPVQTERFAQYLEPADLGWTAEDNGVRRVIEGQYETFIADVEDSVDACPFCMLAIIRQLRITRIPWEYKEAKDAHWTAINDERKEPDPY